MRSLTARREAAAKPGAARRKPRRLAALQGRGARALAAMGLVLILAGAGWGAARAYGPGGWAARLTQAGLAASARLGLAVGNVEVEGRGETPGAAILAALGAGRGTPLLAVAPAAVKERLEALPWIRAATVERRLPDTIRIRIVERRPLAFWQRDGRLALIGGDGKVITDRHLERFPGLIVILGGDAPAHAAALVALIGTEPELAGRVTGAVRIGGRRWNLRLDNGIDVELPEEHPEAAWAELARLAREERLLARDIETVDLRLPDRLVVRVPPPPAKINPKKGRPSAKAT